MAPAWQKLAAEQQAARDKKIPDNWRLPLSVLSSLPRNVKPVFAQVLPASVLTITEVKDATTLLKNIHSGAWTAEDVTRAFCERAAVAQQLVNCLTDIDFDNAIAQAKELDKYFKETGKIVGPLHGLPISVKEHVELTGLKTNLAIVAWGDRFSTKDAVLVATLRKAGAVFHVKTTMPQTGMVLESVSHIHGRTLNPANTLLSAGGSSGGEGALIASRGSPLGLGTDVGGSIRCPCDFNGLYGIKASTGRISFSGCNGYASGSLAIPGVLGPMGLSIDDLKLFCEVACADEPWYKDPNVVKLPWVNVEPPKKLTIGVMWWDGVVMPHPPIRRALKAAVERLRAEGHEVIDFEPHEHQRAYDIVYPLWFTTNAREVRAALAESDEPMFPGAAKLYVPVMEKKEVSVPELYHYHRERDAFRREYMEHWNATASKTSTGRPVDAILTPAGGCASFPHDWFPWWGYLSVYNLLDYPGVIIPVSTVDKSIDLKDQTYTPVNDRDRDNHKIYDPEIWHGAPVSLQLVGRRLAEEKLLAVAGVVDKVIK